LTEISQQTRVASAGAEAAQKDLSSAEVRVKDAMDRVTAEREAGWETRKRLADAETLVKEAERQSQQLDARAKELAKTAAASAAAGSKGAGNDGDVERLRAEFETKLSELETRLRDAELTREVFDRRAKEADE